MTGVKMEAPDKVYADKANVWKSTVTVIDADGKKLTAGTDYVKELVYRYEEIPGPVYDGTTKERPEVNRVPGDPVEKNDILPVNTVIKVETEGKGSYEGHIETRYRIVAGDVSKATITVPAQYFTGQEVRPSADQITVKIGSTVLEPGRDYEVTAYSNNTAKGSASLTVEGRGDYGNSKTVKFTIGQRSMGIVIKFNPNGATSGSMKDQLIYKDTKLTRNAYKRVVDGMTYTFKGWRRIGYDGLIQDLSVFQYDSELAGTFVMLWAEWE